MKDLAHQRTITLELPHQDHTYTVTVALGLLDRNIDEKIPTAQTTLALVSDVNVYTHYGQTLCTRLEDAGKTVYTYVVAAGEDSKSIATYASVARAMLDDGLGRDVAVVALGGGVVGDLAGFIAATYMRGVAVYQCPTSLLAMVDASIGGKTAINVPEGKNLLGAFWQPQAVLADPRALATLPPQVFREGAVELFKHGLLADETLTHVFNQEEFQPPVTPAANPEYWLSVLSRAISVKATLVMGDVHEHGQRAYLNLGHTFGHALEAYSHTTSKPLSHGEAVGYGLVFAAYLGRNRSVPYADVAPLVEDFVRWLAPSPLPFQQSQHSQSQDNQVHDNQAQHSGEALSPQTLLAALEPYLYKDKKIRHQALRWVLLKDIGVPILVDDVTSAELHQAAADLLAFAKTLNVNSAQGASEGS